MQRSDLMQDPTVSSLALARFEAEEEGAAALMLALSVLWHPDARRIGQQALLAQSARPWLLSRKEPLFFAPGEGAGLPLEHASVSRSPVQLCPAPDGSVQLLVAEPERVRCELDGQALLSAPGLAGVRLAAERLRTGVVVLLGGEVWLCLHWVRTPPPAAQGPSSNTGLVGISSAIRRLRQQVAAMAASELPVLLLGESGTGKELVARALHAGSPRRARPMVSVNMAALTEGLAASDLFGAARGAYTGAAQARPGLFAEAAGGTLFLDEIGDTPPAVQPMLLRVIESSEYRALGSGRTERADVRLIAATDRELQAAAGFNQPLLRRLEALVISLPPLRERREDLGVLILHLLQRGPAQALLPPPHLPSRVLRALFLHHWPGNVRQLGHALQRLLMAAQSGDWLGEQELLGLAPTPQAAGPSGSAAGVTTWPDTAAMAPARRRYRAPDEITAEQLIHALDLSGWCLREAAQALGVSRPSLYNLLARHPEVRQADQLSGEEIRAALAGRPGEASLSELASRLRTPREALRRRLRALGI